MRPTGMRRKSAPWRSGLNWWTNYFRSDWGINYQVARLKMKMQRIWSAAALLMAGMVWAQDPAVTPATVPTERPSENIALGASYTLDPAPSAARVRSAACSVRRRLK